MPNLHIGLVFDNIVYTHDSGNSANLLYVGPRRLLSWLENQLGFDGYPENTEYLRIELYRQALLQWAETSSAQPFYTRSFEADRFATAAALLAWRDELLLAGWDFQVDAGCPERLYDLAGVEAIFFKKIEHSETGPAGYGFADRCEQVMRWLEHRNVPVEKIVLYEPEALLPPFVLRVLARFRSQSIPVEFKSYPGAATNSDSDLAWLQAHLLGKISQKRQARNDGSLLVLKSRRDSDAAVVLAQWLAKNPGETPVFLIPEISRVLEQALVQEGLPAMGVLSASLARPSLQVLKLAPAFLWEPVDVYKIMEFVTLPLKPLDDGLALEIARVLAQKPGLYSDTWFAAVLGYLEKEHVAESVRNQYEFWFGRRRYRSDASAPKRDAIELYAYLNRWARELFEETENTSLLVLMEQTRRIRELLETLPEERLSFLELERIIRTIYEPAPIQLTHPETGCYRYIHQPGALAAPADAFVWWNCLFDDTVVATDHWYIGERNWLAERNVVPDTPQQEGNRRLFFAHRPVLLTADRLLLVVPEQAEGKEALPSLLLSDIEAAFNDIKGMTVDLDKSGASVNRGLLNAIPEKSLLECHPQNRLKPQLLLPRSERLAESSYETPTNLESLFYYPHRWFFRQKLKLYPTSLLSVTGDQTLLGSLAHRFFELFLQEKDCLIWKRADLYAWIDSMAGNLLEREGATLLLYGREPERNQFLNRVKNAAWSLLSHIRANGWSVYATEQELSGTIAGYQIKGKADLILKRNDSEWAIVDLKWSGARRRLDMIRNGEDLQLILYAKLLPPEETWAHTGYFILEDGKMIARNKEAFQDAVIAAGMWETHTDACQEIFERMVRTMNWRMEQIRQGRLELRNARTAPELEALYGAELLDLLEMKNEDAWWDDYRIVLGQ